MKYIYMIRDGNGESIYGVFSHLEDADAGIVRLNDLEIFRNRNLSIDQFEVDSFELIEEYESKYDHKEKEASQ